MGLDLSKPATDSFISIYLYSEVMLCVWRKGKMESALFPPTKICMYVAIKATDYVSNFRKFSV